MGPSAPTAPWNAQMILPQSKLCEFNRCDWINPEKSEKWNIMYIAWFQKGFSWLSSFWMTFMLYFITLVTFYQHYHHYWMNKVLLYNVGNKLTRAPPGPTPPGNPGKPGEPCRRKTPLMRLTFYYDNDPCIVITCSKALWDKTAHMPNSNGHSVTLSLTYCLTLRSSGSFQSGHTSRSLEIHKEQCSFQKPWQWRGKK